MDPKDEKIVSSEKCVDSDVVKNEAETQHSDALPNQIEELPLEQEMHTDASVLTAHEAILDSAENVGDKVNVDAHERLKMAQDAAEIAREMARVKREAMNGNHEQTLVSVTEESAGETQLDEPQKGFLQQKALLVAEEKEDGEDDFKTTTSPETVKNNEDIAQDAKKISNEPEKTKPQNSKVDTIKQKKQAKGGKKNKILNENATPKWLHVFGAWFYFLGFAAECRVRWVSRFLKEVVTVIGQLTAWFFVRLWRMIKRFCIEVIRIVVEPFIRLKMGLSSIRAAVREEQKKSGGNPLKVAIHYFKSGMQNHGHLFGNLASIFLPVVATAVLVFLVYSITNTTYGLEVSVQGETIGYIENETVLEEAKVILRNRLRLAGDQNMEDWQFDSTLELARVESYTTKDQLVNAMLLSGAADVVEATGIYMNNELIAVTEDGDAVNEYLNDILNEFILSYPSAEEVSFVNNIQCDPEAGEVFLDTGLKSYEELLEELDQNVSEEVMHTVQEGETLSDIAAQYGITFETLLVRNPQFEDEDIEFEPEEGTSLLIQKEQPFLQVQTIVQETYTESLSFPVEEQPVDDKPQGFRGVVQTGVDGVQEVHDELVYIDGELADRIRLEELTVVVQEAVPEIVQIGTVDVTSRELREFSPVYTWPVPDYTYSSRGGGPGLGHRGRDINAPEGTPVYAANAGVVITSGWHDSYGNYVVIDHQDGLRTLYAHNSFLHVEVGQEVLQNELIANVGNTGFSFGAHLHLEFQTQSGELLNPDDYVVAPHGYSL